MCRRNIWTKTNAKRGSRLSAAPDGSSLVFANLPQTASSIQISRPFSAGCWLEHKIFGLVPRNVPPHALQLVPEFGQFLQLRGVLMVTTCTKAALNFHVFAS